MKLSMRRMFFLLAAISLIITACEKTEYFKSEKAVKEKLKGSWTLVPIPRTSPDETWTFSDNVVYRSQMIGSVMTPIDTGVYTISTSLMKVEIKIENFKIVLDELNGTWQVVTLDSDYLIMATDHDGTTGILQREFTRKQ